MSEHIAFIGGGNMASAIIGGLIKQGMKPGQISVVEPFAEARDRLKAQFGLQALKHPTAELTPASLVVWAVKPQTFKAAAQATRAHTAAALHLSVAAGIRSDSIAHWLGTERVVRAMPNTPALVGLGMTALFGRTAVTTADRQAVEKVIAPTGKFLWLDAEAQLDAVTALSGSGPAYVFYFLEAMTHAGVEMGLSHAQAHLLAVQTFVGASALASASEESPETLRQRVTSKGGTTYAAITAMDEKQVKPHFEQALHAACRRAKELGDEFGAA
ncbi:MAG: pyrroline-5-carboxylate reductase [Gammaproteobacteria bacterium]|nr:pyrroline-5-carboxylate reductase [Gammaproteobacteria bacterium]MBU0788120.1 pyrroline-5-carboxylate reductase [Gammaproteobacteria bacterium]MBU0815382.1 pyrroline-5-carboxylate reductase [Gammaproteobacteria bacterium]MBU1785510.1 pyrroline-5-carboxylate reductase [Gammaproteobacteria bacterium]